MATSDQPFAGLHLSNLASPAAPSLDQQLFGSPTPPTIAPSAPSASVASSPATSQAPKVAGNLATKTGGKPPGNRDAKQPSRHDTMAPVRPEVILETIRLAVRELGRIAGTHRYTAEEKKVLEELVYHYGQRGIETSGNQIIRIGLNYLFEDYRSNDRSSILAQVLERLNA